MHAKALGSGAYHFFRYAGSNAGRSVHFSWATAAANDFIGPLLRRIQNIRVALRRHLRVTLPSPRPFGNCDRPLSVRERDPPPEALPERPPTPQKMWAHLS